MSDHCEHVPDRGLTGFRHPIADAAMRAAEILIWAIETANKDESTPSLDCAAIEFESGSVDDRPGVHLVAENEEGETIFKRLLAVSNHRRSDSVQPVRVMICFGGADEEGTDA